MKKLLSMILAGAMVFALAVPALAADNTTGSETTKVGFALATPTISLGFDTVNAANAVVVNPYKLSYKGALNGASLSAARTDAIISSIMAIENKTNVRLDGSVSVTAGVSGNFALSATPVTAAETKNMAHIMLLMSTGTAKPANLKATSSSDTSAFLGNDATPQSSSAAATYPLVTGVKKIILKSGTETLKDSDGAADVITLAAGNQTTNFLSFTFTGDMAPNPTKAWTSTDKLTISVAWTFKPHGEAPVVTPASP